MERLNIENFEKVVSSEKSLFVIKFSSPTCGPCHTMAPVFEALNTNNPKLNVYEVDTMESPEIAERFGVRGVPYVAYCENREVLYSLTGVTPLVDLQFVVDNIDDAHFRAHGAFKTVEAPKAYWFQGALLLIALFFGLAFLLL